MASDENLATANTLYSALSTFVQSDNARSPALGSILATLSGTLILSCSIEPPTLPTWTGSVYESDTAPSIVNDKTFASKHKLFQPETSGTTKISWLDTPTGLIEKLYALAKSKHVKKNTPYKFLTFDGKAHVVPPVLYFQPYDVSPSSLGLTIAAGLKIELAEIDGFMVPTEHPESSLDDNNSQYLQSAIRADHIIPVLADPAAGSTPSSLVARRDLDRTNQGLMFALISMVKNVFPQFDNEDIQTSDLDPDHHGLTIEPHHSAPTLAYNVKAGTNGMFSNTHAHIWAWSSYRVVHKKKNPEPKDISFICSLRPIYGTNVTLSRSKHPSLLIPH